MINVHTSVCFTGNNCERVVRVVTETCFCHVIIETVIKCDLHVKFPRIFEHNVQICAKFNCKISLMFAHFEYYAIILGVSWGACFVGHAV